MDLSLIYYSMEYVIDVPKSKTVSIAYNALKTTILSLLILITYDDISSNYFSSSSQIPLDGAQQKCLQQWKQLNNIEYILFIVTIILDLVSLIYFYCTEKFSRLQYYVFYCCHIFLIMAMMGLFFSSFSQINNTNQSTKNKNTQSSKICIFSSNVEGTLIFINLIFLIHSLFLMAMNLYIGQKFTSVGSNIFWVYSYALVKSLQEDIPITVDFITFTHLFLCMTSLILLFVTFFVGKISIVAQIWRILMFLSFVVMLLNYLLAIVQSFNQQLQSGSTYFLFLYKLYGPLEIITPLIFLIFVRVEWRDPRQVIIKEYEDIFIKHHENDKFNFGEVD